MGPHTLHFQDIAPNLITIISNNTTNTDVPQKVLFRENACVSNRQNTNKKCLDNAIYKIQYLNHFLTKPQSFEINEIVKNVILGVETSSWLIRANPINF